MGNEIIGKGLQQRRREANQYRRTGEFEGQTPRLFDKASIGHIFIYLKLQEIYAIIYICKS